MKRIALFSIIIAIAAGSLCPAAAEKAERGIYSYNSFGSSLYPLGVLLDNRLVVRLPLSARPGMLWESTKLDAGLQSSWTPADEIFGVRICLEPVAFFSLTGTAGAYGMYNALGYGLYPFSSARDPYGRGLPENIKPQSAGGTWCSLSPELKLRAGQVILVNTVTANFISIDRKGYYLELRSHTMHKGADADLANDLNLLYEFNRRFLAGGVYHYLDVFGTRIESHRVSVLAIGLFPASKLGSAFAAATLGYYPADPVFRHSAYLGMMVGTELKCTFRKNTGKGPAL
jgi:hypothetical protein